VAERGGFGGGSSGGGFGGGGGSGGFGGGGFSEVARVEVGNRLCKHSIKKSCKLQLFFVITCVIISENTSFIMLYTGKFYYYPPVPF
jgi:hypothetical protein